MKEFAPAISATSLSFIAIHSFLVGYVHFIHCLFLFHLPSRYIEQFFFNKTLLFNCIEAQNWGVNDGET